MTKTDIAGLKQFLAEECLNNGDTKQAIISSDIDHKSFMCSLEGGEWANISTDKFKDLMRWKESLGWELDMQVKCTIDGVDQDIAIHDVQSLAFKDGDFVAIGRDVVMTNIDFSQELSQAIDAMEHNEFTIGNR